MKKLFVSALALIPAVGCSDRSWDSHDPVQTQAAVINPPPCSHIYQFRAENLPPPAGASATPFVVPARSSAYRCFTFRSPILETEVVRNLSFNGVNMSVVKQISFWGLTTTSVFPEPGVLGRSTPCSGGNLLEDVRIARGGGSPFFQMPSDVGLRFPYRYLQVRVLYDNTSDVPFTDASSVSMCASNQVFANTAAIVPIGRIFFDPIPPNFPQYPIRAACTQLSNSPVTILSSSPQMHNFGTAFKTELVHNGVSQSVVDLPLGSWPGARYFPANPRITVFPKDVLKTTCNYWNPTLFPVRWGASPTLEEECLNNLMVYPASLVRPSCLSTTEAPP